MYMPLTSDRVLFCFFKTRFGDRLTKLGGFPNVSSRLYTYLFREESESEVQNTQILEEHLKLSISKFHFFV